MFSKIKNLLVHFKGVDTSNRPVPCVECGACCSYFQVGFDRQYNQQVPWQKIVIHKNRRAFMRGSEQFKGRCESLVGNIGKDCSCSIYDNRPDVCRLFPIWLRNGEQNPQCIKAREHHGLKGIIEY